MKTNKKHLPLMRMIAQDNQVTRFGTKDGIPIEKGVIIGEDKMILWREKLENKMTYYSAYPDLFIDEILKPSESNFNLLFMQRIVIRAIMRTSQVHLTAARGFSKSFICILGLILKCIFQPGSVIAFAAPTKKQSAEVGNQKVTEILTLFPLLEKELDSRISGKDYIELRFKNGSKLEITAALESTRGRRFSALMADELRDQNGDLVNSVLLPTLVIARRTRKGLLNPHEAHGTQIYTTSASSKSSYNYEKLLELFIASIVQPKRSITLGIDYRVPVKEGLIDNNYINNMKLSPTFKPEDFAREFLSIYTSDNEDSWFNFSKLNQHRKIVNAEMSAKFIKGIDQFYILSVDVGRLHDQSVCTVIKVTVKHNQLHSKIVNIVVLGRTPETRSFAMQARDIKLLRRAYQPKEIVIDINGLGIGLADELIRPHVDDEGLLLEPLGFNNNDDYKKIQPADAPKILYGIKANGPLNSQMFGNCYSRINSGAVDFLIKEQEARSKLLATKVGQKMSTEKKVMKLMPYEMTTKLFEEMGNLRLKRTGSGMDIVLEQINTRYPKDKFSSLIMGLWRIKELEEEIIKKTRKRGIGPRRLTFYTGGSNGK